MVPVFLTLHRLLVSQRALWKTSPTNAMLLFIHNSHHARFIRPLTEAEKEREKQWIEDNIGLIGWREGWIMYDGTIIILYKKPGLNRDAYYTHKSNYGLNVQVGLLILDISVLIDHILLRLVMFHRIYASWTFPMG